jgi:hypothetical protein
MLREFCNWLGHTPVSELIKRIEWVIPSVQTVHILAIAVVMSSIVMFDARLLGIGARAQPVLDTAERYLPWVAGGVPVLFLSGLILIVGEPGRELLSAVFWLKMGLLVGALVVTAVIWRLTHTGRAYWEQHRALARAMALVSLVLWISIVTAGRWIAYFEHG